MKYHIVILFIFTALSTAQKPLPKYIEPCKRNDPNLNECFAKSANKAMLQLITGDEGYGIPSAMPFKHADVDFSAPGIQFTLMNIIVHGAKNLRVVDPVIDLENNTMKFYFISPMLTWEGDYLAEVDQPSGFGVEQKMGHVNLHFANGKFLMTYQLALENRNGVKYLKIVQAKEEYTTVDLIINSKNVSNGLSDKEWNALKENIINEDFLLICAKAVQIYLEAIFNVVPYDDVFPL